MFSHAFFRPLCEGMLRHFRHWSVTPRDRPRVEEQRDSLQIERHQPEDIGLLAYDECTSWSCNVKSGCKSQYG